MDKQGIIIAGIGGNYDVQLPDGKVVRCRARGVFRKQKITPLIGDRVTVSRENYLESIEPRKNTLIRPAAANVDQVLVVFAVHNPEPHYMLLDRFLLEAARKQICVQIVLNKTDLQKPEEQTELEAVKSAYQAAGYDVTLLSTRQKDEAILDALRQKLENRVTVLAGPSGVGKSSLINALTGSSQETGELSEKIARGKNTTRHARLLPLREGSGWIADTPGFSSFYMQDWDCASLDTYYPEFEPWQGRCRFPDCRHYKEPDCAVRAAVSRGEISRLRYDNYVRLYEDIREYQKNNPQY